MKWNEWPEEASIFWKQNADSVKGYEKHFDWVGNTIKLTISFMNKNTPAKVFEYAFDGIKPNTVS